MYCSILTHSIYFWVSALGFVVLSLFYFFWPPSERAGKEAAELKKPATWPGLPKTDIIIGWLCKAPIENWSIDRSRPDFFYIKSPTFTFFVGEIRYLYVLEVGTDYCYSNAEPFSPLGRLVLRLKARTWSSEIQRTDILLNKAIEDIKDHVLLQEANKPKNAPQP
jgi:hypothetical protein